MATPKQLNKPALHALCAAFIIERIAAAEVAMHTAQESANSETKSSAGDKYETGRAMAQEERNRNAAQLRQARQLLAELTRISPDLPCDTVRPGALVETSLGWFYLSISAGRLAPKDDEPEVFAVSVAAPVAVALLGRRAGEEARFNGKEVRVLAVS